jgi:excisionase family DNA binding protein
MLPADRHLGMRSVESDVRISSRRAGQILQIDPRTVRRLAEQGRLEGRKIGGQWRFSKRYIPSDTTDKSVS